MMYDQNMLSALKNADNFMLCAHINPDGDALGSMLALGRLLRRLGKKAAMVSADPVPARLGWLPDAGEILPVEAVRHMRFDAAFSVDVPETKRMGSAAELYAAAPVTFAVDHHPGECSFAIHALADARAAATGELILALYDALGVSLDEEAATQLYAAISTDTGNFVFNSVSPRTFACMERLMAAGLDISQCARRLFLTVSRAHAAALGRALASLGYFANGRATCMHLTRQDKQACGAEDGDLHGLVNYGLNLDGVCMTFMADEAEDGWKISLRALPGWNVSAIAARFGGGGHMLAAGCVMQGCWEQVQKRLAEAMEEAFKA